MTYGLDRELTAQGWVVKDLVDPAAGAIKLSDLMPNPEAVAPTPGTGDKASRDTHTHPRLVSATRVTLDSAGLATITYTRSFAMPPCITLTAINPSGRTVQLEVVDDLMTGALYTGCTIKGVRAQLLPALTSIVLIAPLVTALQNFDVLGGSAAGVKVNVLAIQPST